MRLWLQLIIEEDIPYAQRKLYPLLPNLNLKLRVGDSLVQEIGGVSLHLRDSKLSSPLKGKLTSLKREKEKYYNNDDTRKFKSDEALHQEELRIFGEILNDKIVTIQKEIQVVEGEKRKLQMEMFEDLKKDKSKQKSLFEEQIKANEQEIEYLRETKRKIQIPGQKPCIWDIDFAEIFGDKGGFDIVIGNPPYVRQEKIAPPNKLKAEVTLEDKREYKDKLLNSIQVHYPFVKKLDKKSDYYIYFYFHGLSLLNDKGTFCFITSNSWLDVGYGKDLQEFLLKYSHVKAIYDNEAKRSFEHADVNTIIALFGPPQFKNPPSSPFSKGGINDVPPFSKGGQGGIWPTLKETTRFVMFKKPFEEAINTKNLLEIENTKEIHKTESYRVYPVKQETLLEEGWEQPEEDTPHPNLLPQGARGLSIPPPLTGGGEGEGERKGIKRQLTSFLKEKFITGKYEGNKWGGKYLRAPDIFFTIIEKGKGKLVRLGDIAEVRRGFTTGCNEFFYLDETAIKERKIEKEFLKPVIKSPRECKSILIKQEDLKFKIFMCHKDKKDLKGTNALKYIEWGEKEDFHKRPTCAVRQKWWDLGTRESGSSAWIYIVRDRMFSPYNPNNILLDCNLFAVFPSVDKTAFALSVNTTVSVFLWEMSSRSYGGGGGPLKSQVYEVSDFIIPKPDILLSKNTAEIKRMLLREVRTIFEECGINHASPVREQKPNPLPDRKSLDDIVFDILGLTEDERNEVYWAVCELVKNRLDKARSV